MSTNPPMPTTTTSSSLVPLLGDHNIADWHQGLMAELDCFQLAEYVFETVEEPNKATDPDKHNSNQFDDLQASNVFNNTDQDAASVPRSSLNEQYAGYHPNQYSAPPNDHANGGLLIWDQEAQQPVNPMPYLNFGRHFEDNQRIAGSSGGSGGSRPANAQKSGAANDADDESPSGASGN